MPARKHPTPPRARSKSFEASGRKVTVKESAKGVVAITLDGESIPGIRRLPDGEYHTEFFPFRGFASAEEVARALAANAGRTFLLKGETREQKHDHDERQRKGRGRGRS
jgi:hypothetical protein